MAHVTETVLAKHLFLEQSVFKFVLTLMMFFLSETQLTFIEREQCLQNYD